MIRPTINRDGVFAFHEHLTEIGWDEADRTIVDPHQAADIFVDRAGEPAISQKVLRHHTGETTIAAKIAPAIKLQTVRQSSEWHDLYFNNRQAEGAGIWHRTNR